MSFPLPDFDLIRAAVRQDLADDLGKADISAELIPADKLAAAEVITRELAIICGIPWVNEVFHQVDPRVSLNWQVQEGSLVEANQVLLQITGPARALLTAERCALNWLQTLSGTASTVRAYVNALSHTKVKLLDTRKTIPGLRVAQKYAVLCGGGQNHRMGLYAAYLIKENHIMAYGSITQVVAEARIQHPTKVIEVEVENLMQLEEALNAQVDIIMLDNFDLEMMTKAVRITDSRAKLEVSGNVSLASIKQVAETGINYISVGALTKHLRAIDLSMRFITLPAGEL